MAEFEFSLTAAPILGDVDMSIGPNRLRERDDLALVSIAAPQGNETAVEKALKSGWGLDSPTATRASKEGTTYAVATSPDQMILIFEHSGPDANRVVQQKLNGIGYTTDQTDVWVALEISGPDSLAALERLCPLDVALMPELGFGRTVMEHMGALVLRVAAKEFLLLSASSSAKSFLHAIETSFRNVID